MQNGKFSNDSYLKMRKHRLYAAALSAESQGIQKDAQPLASVLLLVASMVSTGNRHAYSSYFPPGDVHELLSILSLRYSYTVKVTAWPGATRIIRGVIPL